MDTGQQIPRPLMPSGSRLANTDSTIIGDAEI